MGIEPTALAWEARVLPLYDARFGDVLRGSGADSTDFTLISRQSCTAALPFVLFPVCRRADARQFSQQFSSNIGPLDV